MPDDAKKAVKVDLRTHARWAAERAALFDPDGPFHAHVHVGDPRLVVIVGENASGKSLFFRIMTARAAMKGPTCITLSIRERTGAGSGDMAGMRRVFMFGDEQEQSTGATSMKVLLASFDRNLDRPGGSVLGLDEPELGLSDGYARAMGEFIGTRARDIPKVCSGVIVVTHSRTLVRAMLDAYGKPPTFVSVGVDQDLDQWLGTPEVRSVEDLLALPQTGLDRWRWANGVIRGN